MTVSFADAEPNGLADLVGRLIGSNLERDPERRRLLSDSVVQLTSSDAGVSATVRMSDGAVEVRNGPSARAHLRVVAPADDLLELTAAPLRLGLPDPLKREGRAVIRRIATRDVKVGGMLLHPVRLSRFTRLLSVAS